MSGLHLHTISKVSALFLALLISCGPVSPRRSLQESRALRHQQFRAESKEGSVIKAGWDFKERLKKDYREIIGPSKAYDEMIDLKFKNAVNEAMLETPGVSVWTVSNWERGLSKPRGLSLRALERIAKPSRRRMVKG